MDTEDLDMRKGEVIEEGDGTEVIEESGYAKWYLHVMGVWVVPV